MAVEIKHFTATIPAGTAITSPVTVHIPTAVRVVRRIDWRVPPGAMGVMGWQIAMGGVRVFPTGADLYVVAHGETGSWPVTDAPDSGDWEVIGYNTGGFAHSVYLAVHCDPVVSRPPDRQLLAAAALMPAPDLSHAGPPVTGWL